MTSQTVIEAFAGSHAFDASALGQEELEAIQCAVDCHNAINLGYARLPAAVLAEDLSVGFIWQLYERCTERAFGALVAMATSCPASSEIVSRATLEATVSFRYILRDRNAHLASFLQDHLEQARRQERLWRQTAERLKEPDRTEHLASCEYRRQGLQAMASWVDAVNSQLLPGSKAGPWPAISGRFEAICEADSYRTLYARMCAEPHLDAEETIRHFIGLSSGPQILERMAIETIMFSRLLLVEAVRAYTQAGIEFATEYHMGPSASVCVAAELTMRRLAAGLVEHIGATPD